MFEVNTKQLKDILKPLIINKKVGFVRGAPGIGKTNVIEQVCKEIGYKMLPPLYPGCLQDVEVAGLPIPVDTVEGKKKLLRLIDELMLPAFEAKENSVLFIDEFDKGTQSVQAALAPLIRERYIGANRLPDCVSMIVAGNQREHRTGSNPILTHLLSRFATIINLKVDADCFLEWAVTSHIRPEVTSFIKFQPPLLMKFDADKSYQEGKPYPNPRSWEYVNDLLEMNYSHELERVVYSGAIGEEAAGMFCSHLPIFRTNMNLLDIVTKNGDFTFPKELANRWAFCFGVASMANEETSKRILDICNVVHSKYKETEFAKVIANQTIMTYPELCSTMEWFHFMKTPLGKSVENSRVMM